MWAFQGRAGTHLSAFPGSYMYAEATGADTPDRARLQSPPFPSTSDHCVSFFYHIYGAGTGELSLFYRSNTGREDRLWYASATQTRKHTTPKHVLHIQAGSLIYCCKIMTSYGMMTVSLCLPKRDFKTPAGSTVRRTHLPTLPTSYLKPSNPRQTTALTWRLMTSQSRLALASVRIVFFFNYLNGFYHRAFMQCNWNSANSRRIIFSCKNTIILRHELAGLSLIIIKFCEVSIPFRDSGNSIKKTFENVTSATCIFLLLCHSLHVLLHRAACQKSFFRKNYFSICVIEEKTSGEPLQIERLWRHSRG